MAIRFSDIRVDRGYPGLPTVSLTKLMAANGKRIVDIQGSFSSGPNCADDEGDPVFSITGLVFEDGTRVILEGEHDFVYVSAEDPHFGLGLDTAEIARLYQEQRTVEDEARGT